MGTVLDSSLHFQRHKPPKCLTLSAKINIHALTGEQYTTLVYFSLHLNCQNDPNKIKQTQKSLWNVRSLWKVLISCKAKKKKKNLQRRHKVCDLITQYTRHNLNLCRTWDHQREALANAPLINKIKNKVKDWRIPSRGRGRVFHRSSISPHMCEDPSSVYL